MIIKLLEIRDRATSIEAFAMRPLPSNEAQRYLLKRAGYSCDADDGLVIFGYLRTEECQYSPYDWGGARTMPIAHKYAAEQFDNLNDGDVIDVEFILGEKPEKKISERYEPWPL